MRLITVEPMVFSFVFGIVMLSPLLEQYIYEELAREQNFTRSKNRELCNNHTNADDNVTRLENRIQTQASHWFIALSLSSTLPSLFVTFMLGPMSDATGRKPMLLSPLIGGFLYCLIVSLTVTFGWPFYVIFLGSFVSGLTGSVGTILALSMAYIVDITDEKSRTMRIGVIQIAVLMAATVTFLVSGIWVKNSGFGPPLWTSTTLLFLTCLYGMFLLPESLKEKQDFNKFSCTANFKKIKDFVMTKRGPYINIVLTLLMFGFLFAVFDYFGGGTVLFTKHHPLCWGPEMIGYYMSAKTASAGLGIIFTFKVLGRWFSEPLIVIMGCCFFIASLVVVAFAKTTAAMFVSCIPAFLAFSAPPCIRSIASKLVEQHEEGMLCSILAVTETVAQLIAPLTLNMLYPVGLTTFNLPGFSFLVQAGILLIPITLFFVIYYITRKGHVSYAKMPEVCTENNIQA